MIDFFHIACSQTDLITIGRIAAGCSPYQFFLWQLTLHGVCHRHCRIRCPGNTHGLINIATPGKRIADTASQAGGCPAEGLNFGRMIMGLILEKYQPFLLHRPLSIVHFNRNHNGTGIDFF